MKSFIALFALVVVAAADVSHLHHHSSGDERNAETLEYVAEVNPDGFQYNYKTNNGIEGQASGSLKPLGEESALQVQGSNSHVAPDGQAYSITYIANEDGYQPQGAHLPTPPPTQAIPEYILRSIAYNAQHEARDAKSPVQYNRFQ